MLFTETASTPMDAAAGEKEGVKEGGKDESAAKEEGKEIKEETKDEQVFTDELDSGRTGVRLDVSVIFVCPLLSGCIKW